MFVTTAKGEALILIVFSYSVVYYFVFLLIWINIYEQWMAAGECECLFSIRQEIRIFIITYLLVHLFSAGCSHCIKSWKTHLEYLHLMIRFVPSVTGSVS